MKFTAFFHLYGTGSTRPQVWHRTFDEPVPPSQGDVFDVLRVPSHADHDLDDSLLARVVAARRWVHVVDELPRRRLVVRLDPVDLVDWNESNPGLPLIEALHMERWSMRSHDVI